MKKNLSVGEVAERCNIKVSTVHHYENKRLIHGWRNSGNQRRFSRDVLRRISIIKAAQKVGIKLDDIKASFSHLPKKQTLDESDWQRDYLWFGKKT